MGRIVESGRPPVPPITNEGAVINWFLEHDKHLNGLRANFPDRIAAVATDIQGVLNETSSGRSLHATVGNISKFFTNFTPQEVALYQRGAPFSDDEWSFLFVCELAGAKLRILGYFVKEKYGIDPESIDTPSESVRSDQFSGKQKRVSASVAETAPYLDAPTEVDAEWDEIAKRASRMSFADKWWHGGMAYFWVGLAFWVLCAVFFGIGEN